jgi:predicted nucleic acid-binding protein
MTVGEMGQGALDANWGPRKCAVLEACLTDFSVLHSDNLLCSTWAAVRNESTQKGRPISSADAWIAATVLVLSASLVTNNPKGHRHLYKLQIVSVAPGEPLHRETS